MGKMYRLEGEQSDHNGTDHKERTMKKLLLIVGLALPWTAFADVTFYDQWGNVTGHADQNWLRDKLHAV